MDFPKKQQQCLIPRYLLQYLQDLQISHNDPTAPWGGGGGGGSYTAGDGIDITNDVISIDDTVALKTDLSDYVTSTDLATELLDYAELSDLATVATTGDYNDLLNKPTIPTKTSDLTNDSEYITSSALTGYATEDWVTNQGYQNATDVYIRVQLMLQPYATEQWVTNQGYSTFSGSYNDLTDKPTIPTVPTNVSSFTNDAGYVTSTELSGYLTGYATQTWVTSQGYITSSALNNYVTTNTDQNITGVKTFVGSKMLAFKEAADGNFLGFTAYNMAGNEFGNLQCGTRSVKLYTGSTSSTVSKKLVTLGNYSNNSTLQKDCYVGFRVKDLSNQQRNFVLPKSSFSTYYNVGSADTYYVPMGVTDGTTTCLPDSTGIINISSLISGGGGGGGTTVSGTNDGTNWTSITIGSDTYGIPSGGGSGSGPTITRYDTSSYMTYNNWTTTNKICTIYDGTANSGEFRINDTNPGDILIFDITLLYYSNGYPISKRYSIQLIVPAQSTNTSYSNSHELLAQEFKIYKTGASQFGDNIMTLSIEKINNTQTYGVSIGDLRVPTYFTTTTANKITINAITHIAF